MSLNHRSICWISLAVFLEPDVVLSAIYKLQDYENITPNSIKTKTVPAFNATLSPINSS